ncbi:nitrous oxide reductase family maturation protein NosD [Xanthocytophaga flava]|uniref:nitrous oxide reductase family maturation protein NosD n=1 Tax=Xanthocytophaga flava TaxID=3048013 RepID=UPI0028D4C7E2|nr:nitrous oxide reductase family maturation protein NosD [Xanthocytophaga flavus]MDJ1472324.1 nitrous oxide reductase family maturation protein NosD [Xanthocytophaga flavus]
MLRFFFFFLISLPVWSHQWNVFPKGQFTSIHQVVALAQAADTIWIHKGVYREGKNLVINKPLTLIGIGYPTLDGEKKYQPLTIRADQVTVQGIRIVYSGRGSLEDLAGIKIVGSKKVTIRYNRLENNFFGIYLQGASYCEVIGNVISSHYKSEQNSGNGIHAWKSDHIHIDSNQTQGHRDGIYFEFVTDSKIENNLSEKNIRYGLHFMFSHQDTYLNNRFRNNGAGVAVMYSRGVTMKQNHFEKNWGSAAYGLLLKDISDSHIQHNTFFENTVGIFMEGISRCQVQQNQFQNNGWAARIQASCNDNTFTQNNFQGNSFDIATNGTMVLNTFNQNYWDKYEGYDLNGDRLGDVPYHPVSLYALIVEQMPHSIMLYRSFMVSLIEKAEKAIPSLTPENLIDNQPLMKPLPIAVQSQNRRQK